MTHLRVGLIGHPVAHSRSPEAFAWWCSKQMDVDGTYELVDTPPERLEETVRRLWDEGWHGFNVTIPHKIAVAELLGDAAKAEAVNCVVRTADGWVGHDTDGEGFLQSLGASVRNKRVTLLGTGGSARSLTRALRDAGAEVQAFSLRPGSPPPDLDVDLLVNCTPLGMEGGPAVDWDSLLAWEELPREATVFDLVYQPLATPLVQCAQRRGQRSAMSGWTMLRKQGEIGYDLWLGAAHGS